MRIKRVLAISVVSLASLIVIWTAGIAIFAFLMSHGSAERNATPPNGQKAISPIGDSLVVSQAVGNSSFLYRERISGGPKLRLTSASVGIESEATFSHNGKLVVYSFANSAQSKSSIWIVSADGRNPHPITGDNEDALHPAFSPDDTKVFYAASGYTGHSSPIVGSKRHDWDVFSIPIQPESAVAGAVPTRITHGSFYDLQSVDVANGLDAGESKLLISTTGYPIGSLFEEFYLGPTGRNKIFQPHVKGESSLGPSFGEARFFHNGMDIIFLAATDTPSGTYDYNIYSMSDTTGSEVKQLTHLKGMTTDLRVMPNGNATFTNSGAAQVLDIGTQALKPL